MSSPTPGMRVIGYWPPAIKTDPALLAALREAAACTLSAEALKAQRLSWARGQADCSHSDALRVLEQHFG